MPINQAVSNESIKEMYTPVEQPPKLPQPASRSLYMAKTRTFCRHPEDLNSCRQSLTQAWSEGYVVKHCIIEGLRTNYSQCRQVLLEGLKNHSSSRKSTGEKTPAALAQANDFHRACEEVVVCSYPLKIRTVHDTFHEAYHKLMRSIIWKYGYKDDGMPSSDDIFQEAFRRLHEHLLKEKRIIRSLTAYVEKVTLYACINPGFKLKGTRLVDEDEVKEEKSPSAALVPPEVVEHWEDFDHRLLNSNQGSLINRIILAQRCLEGCITGKRPSAKQLIADWQSLWRMSEADVASLYEKTLAHIKRFSSGNIVSLAADLVNAGLAEPYQVTIVFAAGAGMDLRAMRQLLDELSSFSETAVYARICRIYMVLRPPGTKEK